MTLSRKLSLGAMAVLALWIPSCGSTANPAAPDATATPTPATSTVTVTVAPTAVTVTSSPDSAYVWTGSFVATVSNTNTSPITLRSVTADLQMASAGIVITPITGTDELFRFNVRAPGNRIDVNSTMDIPFTFYYTLPNAGREALVSLAFSVTTDAGGSGSVTATVNFQ